MGATCCCCCRCRCCRAAMRLGLASRAVPAPLCLAPELQAASRAHRHSILSLLSHLYCLPACSVLPHLPACPAATTSAPCAAPSWRQSICWRKTSRCLCRPEAEHRSRCLCRPGAAGKPEQAAAQMQPSRQTPPIHLTSGGCNQQSNMPHFQPALPGRARATWCIGCGRAPVCNTFLPPQPRCCCTAAATLFCCHCPAVTPLIRCHSSCCHYSTLLPLRLCATHEEPPPTAEPGAG